MPKKNGKIPSTFSKKSVPLASFKRTNVNRGKDSEAMKDIISSRVLPGVYYQYEQGNYMEAVYGGEIVASADYGVDSPATEKYYDVKDFETTYFPDTFEIDTAKTMAENKQIDGVLPIEIPDPRVEKMSYLIYANGDVECMYDTHKLVYGLDFATNEYYDCKSSEWKPMVKDGKRIDFASMCRDRAINEFDAKSIEDPKRVYTKDAHFRVERMEQYANKEWDKAYGAMSDTVDGISVNLKDFVKEHPLASMDNTSYQDLSKEFIDNNPAFDTDMKKLNASLEFATKAFNIAAADEAKYKTDVSFTRLKDALGDQLQYEKELIMEKPSKSRWNAFEANMARIEPVKDDEPEL